MVLIIDACKDMSLEHLLFNKLRLCGFPLAWVTLWGGAFYIRRGLFHIVVWFGGLQQLSYPAGV